MQRTEITPREEIYRNTIMQMSDSLTQCTDFTRRSLLSKCQTIPRTHVNVVSFTPVRKVKSFSALIFTKLTNAQYHQVQINAQYHQVQISLTPNFTQIGEIRNARTQNYLRYQVKCGFQCYSFHETHDYSTNVCGRLLCVV